MKVRMGFVTNSSSTSNTFIEIENKELCDILNKYINEMKQNTNKRIEYPIITDRFIRDSGDDDIFCVDPINRMENITTDFRNFMQQSIKEINEEKIYEIFDQMAKELNNKRKLINNSYERIVVKSHYSSDFGGYFVSNSYKEYNKALKCSLCKKPLIYSDSYSEFDCFISDERKIDGYEKLKCSNPKCEMYVESHKKQEDKEFC